MSRKVPRISCTCQFCSKLFPMRELEIKKGKGKFCSRTCLARVSFGSGSDHPRWTGGITHDGKGYPQYSSGEHKSKRVHTVRAEKALGKPLPAKAVVHHVDGDKWNPEARLVICQDQAYHFLLHARAKQRQKVEG